MRVVSDIKQSGFLFIFTIASIIIFIPSGITFGNDTIANGQIKLWLDKAAEFDKECVFDSSLYYYQKILNNNSTGIETVAFVNNGLSILYRKLGKYEEAIAFANKALESYTKTGDSTGIARSYRNKASFYSAMGKYEPALSNYFKAIKWFEKISDTITYCTTVGAIANLYMNMGNTEKAKEYYLRSLGLLKHYPNRNEYADELTNYGTLFFDLQQYDSALYYFNRAFKIYKLNPKSDDIAAAYENIGISQVYLGDTKEGLKNIHIAYGMFNELNLEDDKVSVLLDFGRAFIKINETDSASFYLNKALLLSEKIENGWGIKTALHLLYEMYENNRDYENALKWYRKYKDYSDSTESTDIKKSLQELEVKYETAKREKKIQALKDKELISEANNRLLKAGIFFVIVVFGLLFTILWMKRKQDLERHKQKLDILQKEEALAKAEIERREIKEKQLEEEIEFKTKQLTTHSINMMKKNQLLESLGESFDKYMKSCQGQGKDDVMKLKRQLQQGLNVDQDWELFNHYFEEINEDFFKKLKAINPNLTNNDYRLCALIKLNMNIKEMASVMNISADSLKNARYRLKKKLNLNNGESLPEFIGSL